MSVSEQVLDDFHRVLVDEIRSQRPEYLTGPFTVAEIYQNLVPYSSHRDQIGVEMNGDYEDALLRLLAGEGGFLVLESEPALRDLQAELVASNPNTGLYRDFAAVDVRLNQAFIDLSAEDVDYEPPEDRAPPSHERFDSVESLSDGAVREQLGIVPPGVDIMQGEGQAESEASGESCRWCRAELPLRSTLNYCPFCGTDTRVVPCPGCGEELEPEWRFCISCGSEVTG
jgi:hypothetical protein